MIYYKPVKEVPLKVEEKKLARQLRSGGLSLNEICARVPVAKSTVSRWVRDIPLSDEQIARLDTAKKIRDERFGQTIRALADQRHKEYAEEAIREYEALKLNPMFMFGLALYVGEGTKHGKTVSIVNADPLVLRASIVFFELLGVCKSKLVGTAHVYSQEQAAGATEYWSRALGLEETQFRKHVIAVSRASKRIKGNVLPFGTLHLNVGGIGAAKLSTKIKTWMSLALSSSG